MDKRIKESQNEFCSFIRLLSPCSVRYAIGDQYRSGLDVFPICNYMIAGMNVFVNLQNHMQIDYICPEAALYRICSRQVYWFCMPIFS